MATYTVTISDTDEKILLNNLLDIDEWIQGAARGKENRCWKQMHTNWTDKLMDDETFTDPIPSNRKAFLALVTARDDYKTKAERDAA